MTIRNLSRRVVAALATTMAVGATAIAPAYADWRPPERVSDEMTIPPPEYTAEHDFRWRYPEPRVAMDGAGNATTVFRGLDPRYPEEPMFADRSGGSAPGWSSPQLMATVGAEDLGVARSPSGDTVAVWSHRISGVSGVFVAVRPARHPSFDAVALASSHDGDAVHPDVAVGADGTAVVVWEQRRGDRSVVQAARRRPGGSWSATTTISTETPARSEASGGAAPKVAVGPDGAARAVWQETVGSVFDVVTSRMSPKGPWKGATALDSYSGCASVALNERGGEVVAYRKARSPERTHVRVMERRAGGPWELRILDRDPHVGCPRLAANTRGDAAVIYQRTMDAWHVALRVVERRGAGGWSAPVDASWIGETAHEPRIALGEDGTAVAIWGRTPNPARDSRWMRGPLRGSTDIHFPAELDREAPRMPKPMRMLAVSWPVGDFASGRRYSHLDVGVSRSAARPAHYAGDVAVDPAGNAMAVWEQRTPGTVRHGPQATVVAARFEPGYRRPRGVVVTRPAGR